MAKIKNKKKEKKALTKTRTHRQRRGRRSCSAPQGRGQTPWRRGPCRRPSSSAARGDSCGLRRRARGRTRAGEAGRARAGSRARLSRQLVAGAQEEKWAESGHYWARSDRKIGGEYKCTIVQMKKKMKRKRKRKEKKTVKDWGRWVFTRGIWGESWKVFLAIDHRKNEVGEADWSIGRGPLKN